MTRYYTKNQETDEIAGSVCPKIRKKLVKFEDLSNMYFPSPAGEGKFKVGKYIVNVLKPECSCRRWQLTGIPCHHGIACLRHERRSAESVVHPCYIIASFKLAYGEVIMPCRDEREWQKMNGCPVLPPVYTKTVGRPPTKRRKAPEEKNGKVTRHGILQHCSVCNSIFHNKRKCPELGRDGAAQGEATQGEAAQSAGAQGAGQGAPAAQGATAAQDASAQDTTSQGAAPRRKQPVRRQHVNTNVQVSL